MELLGHTGAAKLLPEVAAPLHAPKQRMRSLVSLSQHLLFSHKAVSQSL